MQKELNQLVTQFLSVIFAAFMVVSFVAFVTIPYNLGSTEGSVAQVSAEFSQPTS